MQIEIEANSMIGEDSLFEGRFVVKGNMRIDGLFEGKALLVDQLQIGAKAKVKTNISATSVIVEGLVIGNIAAGGAPVLCWGGTLNSGETVSGQVIGGYAKHFSNEIGSGSAVPLGGYPTNPESQQPLPR